MLIVEQITSFRLGLCVWAYDRPTLGADPPLPVEDSGLIGFYHAISYYFYQWKIISKKLFESQCDCHPRPTWAMLSIEAMSRIFLATLRTGVVPGFSMDRR